MHQLQPPRNSHYLNLVLVHLLFLFIHLFMGGARACVEVKGQHEGVGCLLPCGTWTLNSDHQAWQWALLLTEPSTP